MGTGSASNAGKSPQAHASLYDQIGGEAAVTKAVDLFYKKVMGDPLLRPFFEGMDMQRQKHMQKAFLTAAFGGPNTYSGRGMRRAHEHLVRQGVGDAHFDAVVEHLISTLAELGISKALQDWARAIASSMRKDVLGG
jgi:hemoglobin